MHADGCVARCGGRRGSCACLRDNNAEHGPAQSAYSAQDHAKGVVSLHQPKPCLWLGGECRALAFVRKYCTGTLLACNYEVQCIVRAYTSNSNPQDPLTINTTPMAESSSKPGPSTEDRLHSTTCDAEGITRGCLQTLSTSNLCARSSNSWVTNWPSVHVLRIYRY